MAFDFCWDFQGFSAHWESQERNVCIWPSLQKFAAFFAAWDDVCNAVEGLMTTYGPCSLQHTFGCFWDNLVTSSVQTTAGLHGRTAAFLHTPCAGSTLVVADALVHALVTRALHQVSHAGGTAIRVTLTGHAALGAREACSTGTATLVQCTIEGLPSTMLPHTKVLLIRAGTTFNADLFIFVLFHQRIMVVHLFHATKLVQFQAAITTSCTWIVHIQSFQSGIDIKCHRQGHAQYPKEFHGCHGCHRWGAVGVRKGWRHVLPWGRNDVKYHTRRKF